MKKNLFKISAVMAIITLMSKIIGLVRDILVAKDFGLTSITDSYNTAISIPNILYMVGVSAIMITFIPNLCEVMSEEGEEAGFRFANKFITILAIIALVITIFSVIFTNELVNMLVPGFSDKNKSLTILLTRIMSVNLVFMVITAVYSSVLRVKEKFMGTALMPIVVSVPVTLYLFFPQYTSVIGLTVITAIGYIMQFIILIPEARKSNYKFVITFNGYNKRIILILKSVIPIAFGLGVSQLSIVIDKVISSNLGQGSITAIELSTKLSNIVYSVITGSIITIFYPLLSDLFINKTKQEWCDYITNLINVTILIICPLTAGLIILNINIIQFLFQRGNFNSHGTSLVTMALAGYVIQLPFLAIRDILGQAFYSTKDTKTPVKYGMVATVLNIVLTIIMSKFWGLFGVTFATSISLILSSVLLLYAMKKIHTEFNIKKVFTFFIQVNIVTIIMAITTYLIKVKLETMILNQVIIILSCVVSGGAVYIAGLYLLLKNNIKKLTLFILNKQSVSVNTERKEVSIERFNKKVEV